MGNRTRLSRSSPIAPHFISSTFAALVPAASTPPPPSPPSSSSFSAAAMSEPSPYAIPTSADPRSKRPTKKRALSPLSQQAAQLTHLFAHPDREVKVPVGPRAKTLPPPPEIVANVQGSSAGAGSGEFHVYKASRRREYERLRLMDEEVATEKAQAEYEQRMEELRQRDEEKTSKNRKRRAKKKEKAKAGPSNKEAEMVDAPPEGKAEAGGERGREREREGEVKKLAKKQLGAKKVKEAEETKNGQEEHVQDEASVPVVEDNGVIIHDDDD